MVGKFSFIIWGSESSLMKLQWFDDLISPIFTIIITTIFPMLSLPWG